MNEFSHRRTWGPSPNYPLVESYVPKLDQFIVIAGPCSVESEDQINEVAEAVAKSGATHLRGGVFRAGTYPGNNFGLIDDKLIKAYWMAAQRNGLKNIIEILDYSDEALCKTLPWADCVQVGARSQQNYTLLKKLGALDKTVFLKRHPGSSVDEWLGSAEHLLKSGPCSPVLIERGSVGTARHVRWDLSISIIPAVKSISKIPVICDPSHGTGRRDLVCPMALAGVAAGASGLLVEVHPCPEKSLSDADQAISINDFRSLMLKVNRVRSAIDDGFNMCS
jgi:3-deoxy-7-phosphoheptulonate synthase